MKIVKTLTGYSRTNYDCEFSVRSFGWIFHTQFCQQMVDAWMFSLFLIFNSHTQLLGLICQIFDKRKLWLVYIVRTMNVGTDRTTAAALFIIFFLFTSHTCSDWHTVNGGCSLSLSHAHQQTNKWQKWMQHCWTRFAHVQRHLQKTIQN